MKSIGMQVRMSISCLWEINVILPQEGWSAIRLEGIPFLETSAKNATNVEEAFMTMASEIKKKPASNEYWKIWHSECWWESAYSTKDWLLFLI